MNETTSSSFTHSLRVEDSRLIQGQGQFVDDVRVPGALAAVFVRSVHAHAAIRSISSEAARAHPGVVAVLTAADMAAAGVKNVSHPPPQKGQGDRVIVIPPRPPLAGDRVVHVGEAVALVVAETVGAARDAADLVDVDYDPMPAAVGARAALETGAPQVWPQAAGNLAIDWLAPSSATEEQVDHAIAEAAHVVRLAIPNQRLVGAPLEPRGATALYDAKADRYTLYTPSQSAHVIKHGLQTIMGLQASQLHVISGDVGGAFGIKTPPYPEHAALLVAARKLGRPVRWTSTRSEAFLSDHQGRDNFSEATLALDRSGRFVALKVNAVTDLGAYITEASAIIATVGFAKCFPGMYDIHRVSVGVRLAFTNTIPMGPYRGAGRPEANYVMERLIDAAARETGIDGIDLRRRNLIAPAAMPYRSTTGNLYDSGDFPAVLGNAVKLAALEGFAERRRASEIKGKFRGVGVSCFLEHAGGIPGEGSMLLFEKGKLVVKLVVGASGQGHQTVFGDLVAARLGVGREQIRVDAGDSEVPIHGGPAVGSRSTAAAGMAITQGLDTMLVTAKAAAAELFKVDPASVDYRDGLLQVAGTNHRISLFELAERLTPDALTTRSQIESLNTYPNGCHIAEVEVDPETGVVTIDRYVATDDCGVVLNHTLAEGQIVGGIAQGLGQALLEQTIYDESGQLLTASFQDYAMPRADNMPPIETQFVEVPCTTNPIGVKGVGETGTTAAIAAIMNAIADAIPGDEAASIEMPATPEKVWRACRGQWSRALG